MQPHPQAAHRIPSGIMPEHMHTEPTPPEPRHMPPPPRARFDEALVELPVHSRLPRLDLGVDWESPWREFRSSVRDFFSGPRPPVDSEERPNPYLRVHWIQGKMPGRAFAASSFSHVLAVALMLLPIWGFLANAQPNLALPRIELTYVPAQDLPPISLPGLEPKPSPAGDPAKPPPPRGADAYHPRQTILTQPLSITHPRQTLIQPSAPPAPPTIVPQMPNLAEWAATSPAPQPRLRINPTAAAPRMQHRAVSDAAAPDVASAERNAGPLDIAASPATNAQPQMPVSPMSKPVAERHATQTDAGAAPEIGPTVSPGDASLHRLIAISGAPAPPAPEISVPQGNLSARVAISPDGMKAGVPGGSEHGIAGNGGSGGAASSAGGAGKNAAGGNSNSAPAGVSISGGSGHPGVAGTGTHSGGIRLEPMPKIPPRIDTAATPRNEPLVVGNIDPSLPPEKILSGKEVFTMHVDMPNLTSASGSWILNFAQLDDGGTGYQRSKVKLTSPVALRKVDPKYPPSAIKERIDGEVILYAIIRKDGSVDSIQLVRGIDSQLDLNSMEALSRWQFRPATREGQPVDIEAVVHIPFHFSEPQQ
jgi:TonB family protein